MNRLKALFDAFKGKMQSLAKTNPVLFLITVISITTITVGLCLFCIGGLLRSIGYVLLFGTLLICFLPDSAKDFLLGLIYRHEQQQYPALIGSNGSRIVPEQVEEEFRRLSDCYESWYFMDASLTDNLIQYHFYVYSGNSQTEKDTVRLTQAIAEKVLRHSFSQLYLHHPDYSALTFTKQESPYLTVTYARNEKGKDEVLRLKEQSRIQRYEEAHPDIANSIITENWEDSPSSETVDSIPYGYSLLKYEDYNIRLPILIPIASHPHALIVGSSGSGKSKALLYLIGRLLQRQPTMDLWLCDFKNSEDFAFLKCYSRYYAGNDCYQGMLDYYQEFSKSRQSGQSEQRHLLVFDEYPACISFYQGKDKQEKTKKAAEILSAVSEILMLGRGINYGLWTVCQRASADIFPQGARDNYMISISLGHTSKEQKGMLFPGEDIPDRIYKPGEGIILADGYQLQTVKFPLIENTDNWRENILARTGLKAPE